MVAAKPSSADPFDLLGRTLAGKYRVDRVIGQGGFGIVYAGVHTVLETAIAIKCMRPQHAASDEEVASESALFLREAKVLFTLSHPAIVRLYEIGTFEDRGRVLPYVVLEFLPGRTLEQEIRIRTEARRRFTAAEILSIFDPVLAAVEYAHANGVVHRDIKPSNIILGEHGASVAAKVVDFGIARVTTDARRSATLRPFTPLYAAPEQWDPRLGPSDARSDVFALGAVLAEMAMLQPLADPRTPPIELFEQTKSLDAKRSLALLRGDLGPAFAEVVQRAISADRRTRTQGVREMREELRAALAAQKDTGPSSEIVAVPSSAPARSAQTMIEPEAARSSRRRTGGSPRRPALRTILAQDADRTVATWGPILVVVWKGTVTVAAAREIQFALRDLAASLPREDVALLTIVEADAPMPSADARTALANILRFCADDIRCSCVVMEGDGFRAAAARSIATGLSLIARQPFPHRIFSTVHEGSRWVAQLLKQGPPVDPIALSSAVEEIRGHLGPRSRAG